MGADPNNLSDHLMQFTCLTGVGKSKRSFMQLIMLLCTWVVWTACNNCLFHNVATDVPRLLDKVKLLSLGWLKAKKTMFVYGTQRWWSNPMACLGIG